MFQGCKKVKVKPLIYINPEHVLARESWRYETVPIGTIWNPFEGGRKP